MSETPSTPAAAVPAAAPSAAPEAPVEMFSREYVQELRSEAASWRTKVGEASTAAKAAADVEWQSKFDEATTAHAATTEALTKSELTLLKLTTVLGAEIPSDRVLAVAELVKGEDAESVSASVASVKALLGDTPVHDRPVDPSQGSGSGEIPLNGDKVLERLLSVVNKGR